MSKNKKSFATSINRVRVNYGRGFTTPVCYNGFSYTTKQLEFEILKQPEVSIEQILEYVRRIKIIFPFIKHREFEGKIFVKISDAQMEYMKGDVKKYAFTKIPVFLLRYLSEDIGQIYNTSFIEEFLDDTRRIDTLKKFLIHYKNNLKSINNIGHSIGGEDVPIMTKKELYAKEFNLVTNYFKKVESKFKPIQA